MDEDEVRERLDDLMQQMDGVCRLLAQLIPNSGKAVWDVTPERDYFEDTHPIEQTTEITRLELGAEFGLDVTEKIEDSKDRHSNG